MKAFTVRCPEDFLTQVKNCAHDRRQSFTAYVLEALKVQVQLDAVSHGTNVHEETVGRLAPPPPIPKMPPPPPEPPVPPTEEYLAMKRQALADAEKRCGTGSGRARR